MSTTAPTSEAPVEPTPNPVVIEPAAPKPSAGPAETIENEFKTVLSTFVKEEPTDAPPPEAAAESKDAALDTEVKDVDSGNYVAAEAQLGNVFKEVKAGYKTTEFWMAAAVIVLTQVGAFHLPGKYSDTITTAAAAASYILSRGIAK